MNMSYIRNWKSYLLEAISIIAKRSIQINSEIKKELHDKLDEFATHNDNLEEIFENKENLITYMPRKHKNNSEILLFILNRHLPKNWKIKSIDNLTELEVANIFKKSKIFLSFSELEGLGLPPIESALCGNHVIGYTGEGGKEFW